MGKLQDAKRELGRALTQQLPSIEILDLAEPADLTVGAAEFAAIVKGVADFEEIAETTEIQLRTGLVGLESIIATQFSTWKTKDAEAQKKIDAKRKELDALRVSFDMAYISKLAQDEASYAQSLKNLRTWPPHLADLRKRRVSVLRTRWAARDRVATIREAFGSKASATLREALPIFR